MIDNLITSFSAKTSQKEIYPEIVNAFVFDWNGAFNTSILCHLKATLNLDKSIEGLQDVKQKVIAITQLVHNLWEHNGDNNPQTTNPVEIVERALQGENFRCVEYGIVLAHALRAIDIPARYLALKMADVETIPYGAGHVVVEAFIDNRWIMIDPQANFIPEVEGKLLNALELSQYLQEHDPSQIENATRDLELSSYLTDYLLWMQSYLYYLDTFIEVSGHISQRIMLVPESAKCPKKYQITDTLKNFIYTHNSNAFYASP